MTMGLGAASLSPINCRFAMLRLRLASPSRDKASPQLWSA